MTPQDHALLQLLKANARASTAQLARQLGLSRTTVQDRIRRLERDGVIAGYTVRLDGQQAQRQIRAEVLLNVNPKQTERVIRELKSKPNVAALYAVSGAFDYLATIIGESTQEIDSILDDVGKVAGIERTQTLVILSVKFER
jgi:DNA-binding Lrp family transcriptional regulator